MFNLPANFILTGVAIVPVMFTYGVAAFLQGHTIIGTLLMIGGTAAMSAYFLMVRYVRRHFERTTFSFTAIETADKENIGIMLLYLMPLLEITISEMTWHIIVPAIVIFSCLAISGYGFHFNPLMNLFKWHFYKAQTDSGVAYVLITKKNLRNVNEPLIVCELTSYTVMDVGGA